MTVKPPAITTVRGSPTARSLREERHGGRRRDERADADPVEVHPERRHHHRVAEAPEDEHGHDRETCKEQERRLREAVPHPPLIGDLQGDL